MSDTALLKQQVRVALDNCPIHSVRRVRVDHDGHAVHLRGSVESFYYKQLAQEVVRTICNGVEIVNEIAVDEFDLTGSNFLPMRPAPPRQSGS
jgi:osmotically-inducible protein OsmY